MALTYSSFSSFDDVVKHYKSIKPMKEKEHDTERNIRPIGDRARKWERIVKISRNCYALSDGYHEGDDKFTPYGVREYDYKTKTTTYHWDRLGKMEYYAPIVWRKHKDGTETVQIRNCVGSNSHYSMGRYAFLERHMPYGMQFVMGSNSLQYVETLDKDCFLTKEKKHYLAKCKTVPRGYYRQFKKATYFKEWMQTKDDNSALVFIKIGDDWVRDPVSGKMPPQKPKVNKELKKKYKEAIDKFFEWGMTMSPMLPLSRDYNASKSKELREYFGGVDYVSSATVGINEFTPTRAREILRSPNHPMRLNYWVVFTSQTAEHAYVSGGWENTYLVKHVETKEQLQKVKNRFNSFINTNAGFMTKPKS